MPRRPSLRRLLPAVAGVIVAAALSPSIAHARVTPGSWDLAQQRQVVRAAGVHLSDCVRPGDHSVKTG